jgi:hypothetical protein
MTMGWLEMRGAAVSATRRGWPVAPGTFLGSDRHWHGRDEAKTLCPIENTWRSAPVTDPERAEEIWNQKPYGVPLVRGRAVDVLELPHRMAELLPALREGNLVVPVAATGPPPRWLLFVATGSGTLSPDVALGSVRPRGAGAWVALPPTPVAEMVTARWTVPLSQGAESTRLPTTEEVRQVLRDALLSSGLPAGPGDGEDD